MTWKIQQHPEPEDHQSMQTPFIGFHGPCFACRRDDDNDDDTSLAGVQGDDTSLAGVQGDDTSLAGVLIPVMINNANDDNSDAESDHNSIDPNVANDNSSKPCLHSTGSQAPLHNTTDEPPQLPPAEEELDNTDDAQLPELETQVPTLCQSKRVSVPLSNYIP